MQLFTEVKIPAYNFKITHRDKLFFIGSCFSTNIYEKFNYFKFNVSNNPFGTVYNPVSVAKQIKIILKKEKYHEPFLHNNTWLSLDFHSQMRASAKQNFINQTTNQINQSANFIQSATVFVITFGSAWVYKLNETGEYVTNCHKLPQKLFSKQLLSIDQVKKAINEIKTAIKQINPQAKFIFTISPVRYIRDGFTENHQSKAVLHLALKDALTNDDIYFPAYEIVLDELRDYRFFDRDLVHPNQLAIDYIWEKFSNHFFDEFTLSLNKKIDKIIKAQQHKPFNPQSEAYQLFVKKYEADLALLPEHIKCRF
jgi:hypothetical protein